LLIILWVGWIMDVNRVKRSSCRDVDWIYILDIIPSAFSILSEVWYHHKCRMVGHIILSQFRIGTPDFNLYNLHSKMYPIDRRTVARRVYELLCSLRQTGLILQVSHSTISRWINRPDRIVHTNRHYRHGLGNDAVLCSAPSNGRMQRPRTRNIPHLESKNKRSCRGPISQTVVFQGGFFCSGRSFPFPSLIGFFSFILSGPCWGPCNNPHRKKKKKFFGENQVGRQKPAYHQEYCSGFVGLYSMSYLFCVIFVADLTAYRLNLSVLLWQFSLRLPSGFLMWLF